MPYTCSEVAVGAGLLLLAACRADAVPLHPRPALSLPAQLAAGYALPAATVSAVLRPAVNAAVIDGELRCGDEQARFHVLLPEGPPRPVVLVLPILAGGDELTRAIARRLVARGFAAVWCERVAAALRPPQRGAELEQLFRRTVVQNRMLLAWLRSCPRVRGSEVCALGVSMGGMVGTVLSAVEPELCAAALVIAGADLPDLVVHSEEGRVRAWLDWRAAVDGLSPSGVEAELRRQLRSDPAALARFIPTDKVFLVAATLDDVIPKRNRTLLWEALGRPRRLEIPLGHYSMAMALDTVLGQVADFFTTRLPG